MSFKSPIPPAPRNGPRPGQTYMQSIIEQMDKQKIQIDLDDPKSLRSIFFSPDLEASARVIQALTHPDNSLSSIARDHATTVEALSTWMARPDVAIRIHNMKHAAAVQHSLAATFRLKHAVNALTIILQEYCDAACHAAGLQSGRGASPSEHIRRDRETARKASQLLARLAHFDQTIRPPRPPREDIRTPHHLPSIFPTQNPRDHAEAMQSPRGHAGAEGASPSPTHPIAQSRPDPSAPPTPIPDPSQVPEDIDPQALLSQITTLLATLGAPTTRENAPDTTSPPMPTDSPDSSGPNEPSTSCQSSSPTTSAPTTALDPQPESQVAPGDHPRPQLPGPAPTLREYPAPTPEFLAKVAACICTRGVPCKGCPPEVIIARYEQEEARARDPTP